MDGIVIMVLGIVFLGTATGTLHKNMDYRLRLAERLGRSGDRNVLNAIQELRAEIAALRKHESDAVLSFDSTLQALDARMTHLERRALGEGAVTIASAGAATARAAEGLRREPSNSRADETWRPTGSPDIQSPAPLPGGNFTQEKRA